MNILRPAWTVHIAQCQFISSSATVGTAAVCLILALSGCGRERYCYEEYGRCTCRYGDSDPFRSLLVESCRAEDPATDICCNGPEADDDCTCSAVTCARADSAGTCSCGRFQRDLVLGGVTSYSEVPECTLEGNTCCYFAERLQCLCGFSAFGTNCVNRDTGAVGAVVERCTPEMVFGCAGDYLEEVSECLAGDG